MASFPEDPIVRWLIPRSRPVRAIAGQHGEWRRDRSAPMVGRTCRPRPEDVLVLAVGDEFGVITAPEVGPGLRAMDQHQVDVVFGR
jgi:hypothetical protein